MVPFDKKYLDQLPVYYRFMKKRSKKELDKVELTGFRISESIPHHSKSYYMHGTYKPLTKVIVKRIQK